MKTPYASQVAFESAQGHAVAIHCSDGRFLDQFGDFLAQGLGETRCDRIVLPGGPAQLVREGPGAESVLEELAFLVEAHKLDRVILIQHEGCGFYAKGDSLPADEVRRRQERDIASAADLIRAQFGIDEIECYFASTEGSTVRFTPVSVATGRN